MYTNWKKTAAKKTVSANSKTPARGAGCKSKNVVAKTGASCCKEAKAVKPVRTLEIPADTVKAMPQSCACACTSTDNRTAEEINLGRISESGMLCEFVEDNMGCWDHAKWMSLCESIENSGFTPVDLDQVGLLLEKCKDKYLSKS